MNRKGFTLIEMFTVMVVVGILAAVAIPKLWSARIRAWDRTAQADVRRAAIAAEGYFADHLEYPESVEDANFDPSEGIVFEWVRIGDGSLQFEAYYPKSDYVYLASYPPEVLIRRESR